MKTVNELVNYVTKNFNNDDVYDIVTRLLGILQCKDYCIWQTYTKEDIKLMDGHYPSYDKWQQLQRNLTEYDLINCN